MSRWLLWGAWFGGLTWGFCSSAFVSLVLCSTAFTCVVFCSEVSNCHGAHAGEASHVGSTSALHAHEPCMCTTARVCTVQCVCLTVC